MDHPKYIAALPILALIYLATLPMAVYYWFRERVADRRRLRRIA